MPQHRENVARNINISRTKKGKKMFSFSTCENTKQSKGHVLIGCLEVKKSNNKEYRIIKSAT